MSKERKVVGKEVLRCGRVGRTEEGVSVRGGLE